MINQIANHILLAIDSVEKLHILGVDAERAVEVKQRLTAALQLLSKLEEEQKNICSEPKPEN